MKLLILLPAMLMSLVFFGSSYADGSRPAPVVAEQTQGEVTEVPVGVVGK